MVFLDGIFVLAFLSKILMKRCFFLVPLEIDRDGNGWDWRFPGVYLVDVNGGLLEWAWEEWAQYWELGSEDGVKSKAT